MALTLSLIAGLSTIIGSIFIFFKKNKNVLLNSFAFAAGVMITVSLIDLIPESFSYLSTYYYPFPALLFVLICFVIGILISSFIDYYIPENNPIYKIGIISLIAIIMHNIPEGIATFMTTSTNLSLGLSLTIAIALHNIPEGISIAVPIYYSTGNRKKALFYTFVSAISEPFGALLAFLFLKPFMNNLVMGLLMAMIAGIMSYISFFELLPKSLSYKNKSLSYIFLVIGIIFMAINHFLF